MTISEKRAPDEAGKADSGEDPVALAEYGFRTAQRNCNDCHEYHALWGYVSLSGTVNGNSLDRDIIQGLLRKLSPPGAHILIAGAADDRLLAMTAQAMRQQTAHITVADRCRTPLLLCQRYADAHNSVVTTIESDLSQTQLTGLYDAILVHYTLRYIPVSRRVFFLRSLGQSLTDGGALVLVHRNPPVKRAGDGATPPREFADRILETLAARKVPLPEDEAQFRRRLEIYAEARHPREGNAMDFAAVEALLVSAGFRIRERIDHDRRRTIPVWGGDQPAAMATRIFVASFGN